MGRLITTAVGRLAAVVARLFIPPSIRLSSSSFIFSFLFLRTTHRSFPAHFIVNVSLSVVDVVVVVLLLFASSFSMFLSLRISIQTATDTWQPVDRVRRAPEWSSGAMRTTSHQTAAPATSRAALPTAAATSSTSTSTSSAAVFDETPFEDVFDVGQELGSGQFAVVPKFIKKRRYATSRRGVTRQNIEREVQVLKTIKGHSNVINLHGVYETPSDVILVLELVSGGELFDHVCAKECLDEAEAAAFIKQILLAVQHLHSLHIVHLDIKPENVMLKKRGDSQVKLIDFGLSRRIPPGVVVKDMVGTPEFVAPEVVNYEPLSPATDMWAVGVVTYILLSGGSPFLGDTRDETFCNITRVKYYFSDRYFKNTSQHARDFISRLFVRDVHERATVEECLRHPWIRGPEGNAIDIRKASTITISHIQAFKTRQRWRRIVDIVIVCNQATKRSRAAYAMRDALSAKSRFDPEDLLTSAVLSASEEGNLRALNQLSALHRLYPNTADKKNESAVHVAAEAGQAEVVNYLHMKGAHLTTRNSEGDTPLHKACRGGHSTVVAYLVNERAEVDSINKNGETPMHCALESDVANIVRMLVPLNPRLDLKNANGDTAMHCAARSSNPQLITLLTSLKAPLDVINLGKWLDGKKVRGDNNGPNRYESTNQHKEWNGGRKPPSPFNHSSFSEIFCRFPPTSDDQFTSVELHFSSALRIYRQMSSVRGESSSSSSSTAGTSSDIEETTSDEEGTTPYAIPGSVMATYLADPVANPAAKAFVESPRPRAADFVYPGHDKYSKLGSVPYSSTSAFIQLVHDISNFSECDCFSREETALHIACSRGHADCVHALLESDVPIDATDENRRTALHVALEHSHVDIAVMLITKGCRINEADNNGNTPLHVAARCGLLPAVQTLCHCSANVDSVNKATLTPLHVAAREGFLEIVRVFCLARADVLKKTKEGMTAELIAVAQEHSAVAAFLVKMKDNESRETFIQQLYPLDVPLKRIKLKLFGHSMSGKTRLVQALHSTRGISSFIESVSRRISDHYSPSNSMTKDDGVHSEQGSFASESNNNSFEAFQSLRHKPPHSSYTRGIDVQTINCTGVGEFSVWEFGGYDVYHTCYDHFVGNTDCIHLVLFRACDPTEVQYKQILYWMNFLKGRVTPTEPIGHCGIISRRSKVIIVGTHATPQMFSQRNSDGEYVSSDTEAMLKTVRLRFETHFDMDQRLILLDATNPSCIGMKSLKQELIKTRATILTKLLKPLGVLDMVMTHLNVVRKQHANFPVITWPHFTSIIRNEINPLTGDTHCRQIIQQLQLVGEVVYLRNEQTELDYVVLNAEWLGTHVIGQLLSPEFLSRARANGIYSVANLAPVFPEIPEPADLMHILDTLQLCAPVDSNVNETFEYPPFIHLDAPADVWLKDKPTYVYGGVRIMPMRGMEKSLQSTFPRIQVALRRSMNEFQDPMDAELMQWFESSKMSSGRKEALIKLVGDAVEIKVRGPSDRATSCFYFMEDLINLVEQTACEVAPGIALERHFLSPKQLRDHVETPAQFLPEAMMEMQQKESLSVKGTQEQEELFTDVVCFGSRDVARLLTLGIDVSVAELQMTSRCELACLLDPPDAMGRDWSILAVKLQLTDQVPDVDSTGQSLSRTDQLLNEWAIHHPDQATVGNLCRILVELGRTDARDALYRTVPLYLFAPLDDQLMMDGNDSGVVSSCHSSAERGILHNI
ncbi:unnamed protein product [Caenorhabditis auriculariae]|uniref:Non-specific serine/threonine protein kinase n=1 Tax=Caenorhabditis auriculariae TaxID=2777116 RepID=A0A8S1GTK8_9PELO|nr:unnamed protein product [Caenorhabditis auriculariae]